MPRPPFSHGRQDEARSTVSERAEAARAVEIIDTARSAGVWTEPLAALLERAREDPSVVVRAAAVAAVAAIPEVPWGSRVEAIVHGLGDRHSAVREQAAAWAAALRLKDEVVSAALQKAYRRSRPELRRLILRAMAVCSAEVEPSLTPVITADARGRHGFAYRNEAIRTLGKLHARNSDVLLMLREAVNSELPAGLRVEAALALLRTDDRSEDVRQVLERCVGAPGRHGTLAIAALEAFREGGDAAANRIRHDLQALPPDSAQEVLDDIVDLPGTESLLGNLAAHRLIPSDGGR